MCELCNNQCHKKQAIDDVCRYINHIKNVHIQHMRKDTRHDTHHVKKDINFINRLDFYLGQLDSLEQWPQQSTSEKIQPIVIQLQYWLNHDVNNEISEVQRFRLQSICKQLRLPASSEYKYILIRQLVEICEAFEDTDFILDYNSDSVSLVTFIMKYYSDVLNIPIIDDIVYDLVLSLDDKIVLALKANVDNFFKSYMNSTELKTLTKKLQCYLDQDDN